MGSSVGPSLRESCPEAGLQLGDGFDFHSQKGVPFPLPWFEDTPVQPSPGPAGLWTLYLHRECPGHPWFAGVPASSAAHSCLSPLPLWAEPQVRLSLGSASVSVGFSSSPAGFAWLPVGCFWGLGVCSRTLQNDAQIKEKAAHGRMQLDG